MTPAAIASVQPTPQRSKEPAAPAREDDRNAWAAALIAEMRKGAKAATGRTRGL